MISHEDAIGGPGELDGGTTPTGKDGDGLPGDMEASLGTDPKVADSMKLDSSGYTWLEVWANSLVPEGYASQVQ